MLNLGLIGFTQPWLLAAFVVLPGLWLLLRLTSPAPRRLAFPGWFLLPADSPHETPARTPLWLLLLRLLVAALLILALAGPVLSPQPRLAGGGPLLLVLDDGWPAAAGWSQRLQMLRELLGQAEREHREVAVLRTAPDAHGVRVERGSAGSTLKSVAGWAPKPWPIAREAAVEALAQSDIRCASVVWLCDGIAGSPADRDAAGRLAQALGKLGPVRVIAEPPEQRPNLLLPPQTTNEGLGATGRPCRPDGARRRRHTRGRPGRRDSGSRPSRVRRRLELLPARASICRASCATASAGWSCCRRRMPAPSCCSTSAGGVRSVGLYGAHNAATSQPLLADLYFIERALAPYAEIREGSVAELLQGPLSMVAMADVGRLGDDERKQLEAWMNKGGVVLRFAGPHLASGGDDFVPVKLRQGDRQLGGAMSWSQPLALAAFDAKSPFAGLQVTPEARVSRQVLAEPGPDLAGSVLASLADGTPIVTGKRFGTGWLILFHTTANTAWSSLPLSGLFVDMLRRVLTLAPGSGGQVHGLLSADSRARWVRPPERATGRSAADRGRQVGPAQAGPGRPTGLYAPAGAAPEQRGDVARVALNVQQGIEELVALEPAAFGTVPEPYRKAAEVDLARWLLLAAFLLLLADLLIAYAFRGLLPDLRRKAAGGLILLALGAGSARAAELDDRIRELTAETHLGYVRTGLADVDEISRAGLVGLGQVLEQRTSIETGDPVAVDPAE